jgi:hypothetical protein
MKKNLNFILIFVLCFTFSSFISAEEDPISTNQPPQEITVTNDKGEEVVLKLVKEFDQSFDKNVSVNKSTSVNSVDNEYAIKSAIPNYYSKTIGSSYWIDYSDSFSSSSGSNVTLSVSVSESVDWGYSFTAGVTGNIFSASTGISYNKSETVINSATHVAGDNYTVLVAFPKYKHTKYEIWENRLIWSDRKIGTAVVDDPVGVHFAVYE